jgi:hypothetical protein
MRDKLPHRPEDAKHGFSGTGYTLGYVAQPTDYGALFS